ncbi:MAG: type II secretion system protein [Erysipelotrichaceae bacterium]
MKNKSGFTLIELIVVIAILGVLALILVPNFMGYLQDAKKTTATSNARAAYSIATAECAKGQTSTAGSTTAAKIKDVVDNDYPSAKVVCNDDAKCTVITSVEVTSSGITATATKGAVTVNGESA